MTDQSSRRLHHDALDRVLEVARLLGASADLDEILQVIIDALRDVLQAERATVFQFDPASRELYTTVAHGLSVAAAPDRDGPQPDTPLKRQIRVSITDGIVGEAARTRRIINISDAYSDPRFNAKVDRETGFRTRSILSIPLIGYDGELMGVAQVLNKSGGAFASEDEQVAAALASQAAVAIKRGRLIQEQLIREKLERDLALARQIQQKTLPETIPQIEGFDIAAWSEPAEETGGDIFDVILPQQSSGGSGHSTGEDGPNRVMLLMADATGHGIGPALMAASIRSMTRMAARVGTRLADIVSHLNVQICMDAPAGRFVTAWLGIVDNLTNELLSFSAGQAPLIHYHADTDECEILEADELPLGIIPDWSAPQCVSIQLRPGDIFATLSDGLLESADAAGKFFGSAQAAQAIRSHQNLSAAELIQAIRAQVGEFSDNRPAADDRTAVVVKRRRES